MTLELCSCVRPPELPMYTRDTTITLPESVDNRDVLGPIKRCEWELIHSCKSIGIAISDINGELSDDKISNGKLSNDKLSDGKLHVDKKHQHGVSVEGTLIIGSIDDLKSALSCGYFGIMLMLYYNDSMLFWRQQSPRQESVGVTACVVVGYDDDNQWLILRCHRGEDWGHNGYCYYPYSDWIEHHHCYCVVVLRDNIGSDDEETVTCCCSWFSRLFV